jgi:hypothetical protein
MDLVGIVCIVSGCVILSAPVWVPVAMFLFYAYPTKSWSQFSLWFLLAMMAVESVAVAISVAFWRWANSPPDWPIPG